MLWVSGKVSVYEQGSTTRLIISDPKLAKEVLVAKGGHYHKSALSGEVLRRVTGEGSILVTEEGQWKEQNHIMSPAFRHNFLTVCFNPLNIPLQSSSPTFTHPQLHDLD
jgi:cytochrome P450